MSATQKSISKITPRDLWWENADWAREHATELHEQYEGKWIAVVDGGVVAVGSNPLRIRKTAARSTGRTTDEVYVTFLESAAAIYGTDWTLV